MTQYVCAFCESEMTAEQFICCDTYKGKMTVQDFIAAYGEFILNTDWK